jgi:hypothetical protein
MKTATFPILALVALGTLAPAGGLLKDAEPAQFSSRLDGPGQERMLDLTSDTAGNTYIIGSFNVLS